MEVRRIMTRVVETARRDTSVRAIAMAMRDRRIGVLPVVENGQVVGVITDRDIVTRLLPECPSASDVTAETVMTDGALQCYEDQKVTDVAAVMGDHQVRRLPVLDRRGRLVGIVTVGDIAENASERLAGEALGEIVESR